MTLAACAIFKDEGPYIEEWLSFHRAQGVDRFFLYDNGSTDGGRELMEYFVDEGWPIDLHMILGEKMQPTAYADCIERHGNDADWIAFLDIDEFLFSPQSSLPRLLVDFQDHPGVVANWCIYGPGGHETKPPGGVVESYLYRATPDYGPCKHVKSIVQPQLTKPWPRLDAHHFLYERGDAVNERFEVVRGPFSEPVTWDLLRVNHYWSKSVEECHVRCARNRVDTGEPRGSLSMFLDPTTSAVYDDSALRALQ